MEDMDNAPETDFIENRVFDELRIGDTASISRTITEDDISLFAVVSGDVNPAHLDTSYAETDLFHKIIIHGMWGGALISAVLGTRLPGPGTIYLSQDLHFRAPAGIGDTITASVTVKELKPEKHRVVLDCSCVNQGGTTIISGVAEIIAPTEKIRRPRIVLPGIRLARHRRFASVMERAAGEPVPVAVCHPCDATSLTAAVHAAREGLVAPILVGPPARIRAAALEAAVDISPYRLVETAHSHESAARAVALARAGEAAMLMKGSLHTDEMMHEVVQQATGLRTARRISHVYVMDVPSYPRLLLVTDAAVNITPDLEEKAGITQNAIDLARALGVETPKVAILAAVETVNPSMRSTLDAAALCKMADRGQIKGGLLDGPLAFDNAVNAEAARQKHIVSDVAGQADILLVPDLEAGNILAKQLVFLADADAAGIVLGARVPIILTSRADSERTRLTSCALGVVLARNAQAVGLS
jgi:phosphotransacetylase/acyl dehydratase